MIDGQRCDREEQGGAARDRVVVEMLNAAMATALGLERSLEAAARHLAAAEALQLAADEKALSWMSAVDPIAGGDRRD